MAVTRLHITVLLAIAVLTWAVVLCVQGAPLAWEQLAPFGSVVGVLAFVAVTFDRVLWRMRWLHGWFVRRPDLRGTWKVKLRSDWIDPTKGTQGPPITCFMGVTQTFSTLQMHLMTPESESWLVAEAICPARSGTGYEIAGVYTNKPGLDLRGERSEIHFGAIALNTHGPEQRPDVIDGEYWTDRKTSGRMELSARVSEVFTRFTDANHGASSETAGPSTQTSEGDLHDQEKQRH